MKTTLTALAAMLLLVAFPAVADHHEGGEKAAGEWDMGPTGPPAELKELAYVAGDWDVAMKMRMGPDAPWMESAATASVVPILGGGVYQMTYKGDFYGTPMTGMLLYTYDREQSRYETMWIDNFACRMSESTGQIEGDTLTLMSVDTHMGQTMHMKQTQKKVDENTMYCEMHMSMDGENWFKHMEFTYTRAGDAR